MTIRYKDTLYFALGERWLREKPRKDRLERPPPQGWGLRPLCRGTSSAPQITGSLLFAVAGSRAQPSGVGREPAISDQCHGGAHGVWLRRNFPGIGKTHGASRRSRGASVGRRPQDAGLRWRERWEGGHQAGGGSGHEAGVELTGLPALTPGSASPPSSGPPCGAHCEGEMLAGSTLEQCPGNWNIWSPPDPGGIWVCCPFVESRQLSWTSSMTATGHTHTATVPV